MTVHIPLVCHVVPLVSWDLSRRRGEQPRRANWYKVKQPITPPPVEQCYVMRYGEQRLLLFIGIS